MARNGQNNAAATQTATPDAARQAYIDSLKAQHAAAMTEIENSQGQMTALETALTASRQRVEATANTLRQLGEEVAGAKAKRGRPVGSRNASSSGRKASGRTRPKNASTLDATVVKFMSGSRLGTEFTVPEITAGLNAAGWQSSSKTPGVLISQAFSRLIAAKSLKRAGRGVYVLTERGRASIA